MRQERAEDSPELPPVLLATAKSGAVQKFRDHLNVHGTRLDTLSLGRTGGQTWDMFVSDFFTC